MYRFKLVVANWHWYTVSLKKSECGICGANSGHWPSCPFYGK